MVTKYLKLRMVKAKNCAGKATAAEVKSAAADYVKDAVKKGRTKAAAESSANKVVKSGCAIAGIKRRKRKTTTAKRKTAVRRRRRAA